MRSITVVGAHRAMLIPCFVAVDIRGMAESPLLSDILNAQNLQVLQRYADRARTARAANPEYSGWLARLEPTSNLNDAELTRAHGELIAMGMLRFQLTNRTAGLQYQISDRGNEVLKKQPVEFPTETPTKSTDSVDNTPLADAA